MLKASEEFGIPTKLLTLIKGTLKNVNYKGKYTYTALRQGKSLACLLFNVVLVKVMKNAHLRQKALFIVSQYRSWFILIILM
jgi:hypothetical protein